MSTDSDVYSKEQCEATEDTDNHVYTEISPKGDKSIDSELELVENDVYSM